MQQLFGSQLKAAAENNFIIALTASLATLAPYVLYHHQINIVLGVEVLFATFFTYTAQRLIGYDLSIRQLPGWKKGLLIFSGLVVISLAFFLSLTQILLLGFAGVLSLLYVFPAIPFNNEMKSLRQIPYLKIWTIITVWITVICLAPLSDLRAFDTGDLLLSNFIFIIQQGAFIFALTIPFDIRDMKVDEPSQKTIPILVGVERSLQLAKSMIWLSFFATGINFLLGFFDLPVVLVQLIIVAMGLGLLRRSQIVRKNTFYLLEIDGLIALQAALFLLSWFI